MRTHYKRTSLLGVGYERKHHFLRYLLAHNAAAAHVESQRVLDHTGIVANFVTGSLARLQNRCAYAMAGDTAKAKSAYQRFFALSERARP